MDTSIGSSGKTASATTAATIGGWLDHLAVLWPPGRLVHVGAGSGDDLPDYQSWAPSSVLLVEADEGRAKRLVELTMSQPGWAVLPVLVGVADGEACFYVASHPRESGLLAAEALRGVWRNLKERERRHMTAVCLDTLLPADEHPQQTWLLIDCLPAAALLRGAQRLLDQCQVLLARVSLLSEDADDKGTTLAELDLLAQAHGLSRVAVVEELMPLLAQALYVRLPSALAGEHEGAAAAIADSQQELAALVAERETLLQDRIQFESEHESLARRHVQLREELAAFTRVHDQLARDYEDLMRSAAVTEASFAGMAQVHRQVEEERDAAVMQQAKLQAEIDAAHAVYSLQVEEIESMRRLQSRLEADADALRVRVPNLEVKNAGLQTALAAAEARLLQLQSMTDELAQQVTNAEALAAHRATELADMSLQLQTARTELGALHQVRNGLQADLAVNRHGIEALEQEKQALVSALAESREQAALIAHQLDESEARWRLQAGELASRETALAHATQQQGELVAKVEHLDARLGEREADLSRLAHELSERAAVIAVDQRQQAEAAEARQRFEIEMARAEAQIALIRDIILRAPPIRHE